MFIGLGPGQYVSLHGATTYCCLVVRVFVSHTTGQRFESQLARDCEKDNKCKCEKYKVIWHMF